MTPVVSLPRSTRSIIAALLLAPSLAAAQVNVTPTEPVLPGPPALQSPPPPGALIPPEPPPQFPYQSRVSAHKPSPVWTQDRGFSTTRFWVLDPGTIQIETWAYARIYPTRPERNGARNPASMRFFEEIEWGVAPHLQIDLYGDFHYDLQSDNQRHLSYEAWRAELRIAIPNHYGQLPLNPVVYFEWISSPSGPARAEARVLLGGSPTPWLFLAANPYFELNVQQSTVDVAGAAGTMTTQSQQRWLEDAEAGTTLAAGFRVTDWLRLSVETKIGVDMLGDALNKYHFVWWAGPGFIIKPLPERFRKYVKIVGTVLFKMPGTDTDGAGVTPDCFVPGFARASSCYELPQMVEPTIIIGSQL